MCTVNGRNRESLLRWHSMCSSEHRRHTTIDELCAFKIWSLLLGDLLACSLPSLLPNAFLPEIEGKKMYVEGKRIKNNTIAGNVISRPVKVMGAQRGAGIHLS